MNRSVFIYGLEESTINFIQPFVQREDTTIFKVEDLDSLLENPPTFPPCLILCGPAGILISSEEAAQFFRGIFQETPVYFLIEKSHNFDRVSFKKNGFNDVFILTLDFSLIQSAIESALTSIKSLRAFRSVKLIDLCAGVQLSFDLWVFLPANNKHVLFLRAGEIFSSDRLKKLQFENFNSLHVTLDQIQLFRDYTSSRLLKNLSQDGLSTTERAEKLKESVRILLSGLIGNHSKVGTFSEGKTVLVECRKIVETFMSFSKSGEFYSRIKIALDDMSDAYTHSSNVSTFATLFSLGTKLGDPETCSMAGLLHDVGMVKVSKEIQGLREDQLTQDQKNILHSHVQAGLDYIIYRKMIIPEIVKNAVAQHHERPSGSGYPKKLQSQKIIIESQIVGIADCFDYLTRVVPGRKRLTPLEAIHSIYQDSVSGIAPHAFDPKVTQAVLELFPTV